MHGPVSDMTVLGAATVLGFHVGKLAKRVRLPSLIGYMLLGVVMGPSILDILDETALEHLAFLTQIALGLVAFGIGAELDLASLRRLGYGIICIIFAESFTAFLVVTAAVWLLTGNVPLALVFGAMAPASAPAGTVAVIQEYRAKGTLTKALYAVVGFDDGLAIIIFGFAAALAKSLLLAEATGESTGLLASMEQPLFEIVASIAVGAVVGLVFCRIVRTLEHPSDMLVMIFGAVLISTGLSTQWHLSLILTNLVVGFMLANTCREELVHRVAAPLLDIMPFIFIIFFCIAGAHLEVSELPSLGLLGVVYILARSAGLIGGARIGASFGGVDENVKKYIGLGILSQAGVAIGLSLVVQQDFGELVSKHADAFARLVERSPSLDPVMIGATVLTTITATCIVFEIIGPVCTRFALRKAGEIPDDA